MAATVRGHGHDATDLRDIGLGAAADSAIAAHAKSHQFAVLTADLDFANIVEYPPADYAGIVVIRPPDKANRDLVLALVKQFLQVTALVAHLQGRLAIVEPGRIRMRPTI